MSVEDTCSLARASSVASAFGGWASSPHLPRGQVVITLWALGRAHLESSQHALKVFELCSLQGVNTSTNALKVFELSSLNTLKCRSVLKAFALSILTILTCPKSQVGITLWALGRAHLESGDPAKARDRLERAVRIVPLERARALR